MRHMAVWGTVTRLGLLAAVIVYGADRLHKWWMIEVYRIGERGPVDVTSFFQLKLVKNAGISYGLLPQDSPAGQYVLIGISIIAAILLTLWLVQTQSRWVAVSLGLIIGGALGNATDRALNGAVSDFFYFHPIEMRTPLFDYVFNVADVAIVGGVLGLVIDAFFLGQTAPEEPRQP
jgi:signal peptidase II